MASPDPGRLLRERLYIRRRLDGDSAEQAEAFVMQHFARTGFTPEAQALQQQEDAEGEAAIDARLGPGRLRAGIQTTLQGVSGNLSDEVGGAIRSLPALVPGGESFGDALSANIDRARAGLDDARESYPGQSIATEIGGAAIPIVLTGGMAAPAAGAAATGRLAGTVATAGRIARTPVRGGAMLGAAYSAGAAEGNPLERLDEAAIGGGLGLGAGAAFVGASRLAGPVASRAVDIVRPQLSGVAERIPQIGIQLVRDRAVASLSSAMERAGVSAERLATAAADSRPGETIMDLAGRTGVDRGTLQRMGIGAAVGGGVGSLEAGDSPIAATAGAIAGAAMGGRLPGNAVSRLGRAVQSIPSEGSDRLGRFLNERASGTGGRLRGSIERRTGQSLDDVTATADELVARRAQNAAPAYAAAYQYDVSDPVIRDLFNDPAMRRAYRAAQQLANEEMATREAMEAAGREIPADLANSERLPELFRELEDGSVEFLTQSIPVRAIDYMKRGLDAVVERGAREGNNSLTRREASLLADRVGVLRGRTDELVPEYGAARSQYGGDSESIRALALARGEVPGEPGFLRADPRVLARTLEGMSASERDLYRRGALDALRHEIESTAPTYDLAARITRRESPEMIERLRLLFDTDDQFAAFMDDLGAERGMAETRQFVTGGSPTARIQADQNDVVAGSLPRVTEMLRPGNLALRALDNGVAGRLRGLTEATVDELEPFLTTPLDQGGADLIQAAIEQMRRREAQALPPAAGRLLGRAAAFGTGAYAGRRPSQEP